MPIDPRFPYDAYIAYAHPDVAWARRLVDDLRARDLTPIVDMGPQIRTVDMRPQAHSSVTGGRIDALRSSRRLVVLVSELTLGSDWLRTLMSIVRAEQPSAFRLARPIAVILTGPPAPADGYEVIDAQDAYAAGLAMNDKRWSEVVDQVEKRIRAPDTRHSAQESPPLPVLSLSAREVLSHAARMIDAGQPDGGLDLGAVRAAVLLGAVNTARGDGRTGDDLRALIVKGHRAANPQPAIDRAAHLVGLGTPSREQHPSSDQGLRDSPVAAVISEAAAIQARVGPLLAPAVHLRHLLAATLAPAARPGLPRSVVAEFGGDLAAMRAVLHGAIGRMRDSNESPQAWAEILLGQATQDSFVLAGGFTSDVVDPTIGIPLDSDNLEVRNYVTMLATVIADKRTPMPVSIGLFGEWGSGKSYFMGLLRGQVDRLAASDSDVYCGVIKQIPFNAWHYADTNLWASLGDEIFRQLAGPDPDGTIDEQRRHLRDELEDKLQGRAELLAANKRAKKQAARLSAAIESAMATVESSTRELLAAARESDTVRSQLARAGELLGVSDAVEQARLLDARLAAATPGRDDALRRLLTSRAGTRLWIGALAVLLAIALAIVVPSELGRWLAGGGFATLAALVAAALALTRRFISGYDVLGQVAREIEDNLQRQPSEALRNAQADERMLRAQLGEVEARVGELGLQLAELSPGRRLYSFIAERAGSEDYRRHLGLISTVRKDFEQLTTLMAEWAKRPPAGESDGEGDDTGDDKGEAPLPIDRIVLYIDDLDRCSSRQVVDVLQAVHLLLALKLFVVVVGVDPRWLLRSLTSEYDELLTTEDDAGAGSWQASPQDYLEKIFNIPFALPGMSPSSFEALLTGLTAEAAADATSDPAPRVPGERSAARDSVEGEPDGSQIPVEPGSEVAAASKGLPAREIRPLTTPELRMLTALAPLVGTPRDAKRLVNLYRMIRSTADLSPVATFLGDEQRPGEFQAVIILFGLVIGQPRLAESVFAAAAGDGPGGALGGLRNRPPQTTWETFASGIEPRRAAGTRWSNDIVGAVSVPSLPSWQQLSHGLTGASGLVTLPDLTVFQAWAPRIARFSFRLSPYASDVRPRADRPPA